MKHLSLPASRSLLAPLAAVVLLFGAALPASADWKPDGMFVEGAVAEHSTYAATVGVNWNWSLKRQFWGGEWTGTTEAFVSHWNAKGASGREGYTLAGLAPLLRYRFGNGSSPWFFEGGIGLSVLDSKFVTPNKNMSTEFNFYDVLAAGRSFGTDRNQEVSLRVTHLSNAGIKKPNPGENFLQLRYGWRF